jgi:oxalate decarboxylase/phosphoglucose isomerase-like protein (cupin superfamily)
MEVREHIGNTFPYDDFMAREGLPVHRAVVGVEDVTALPRAPWARLGGRGTFIQLLGTYQSQRGIYVAEIPGGQALEPEKHLYEEEIFVLKGRGMAQVWQGNGPKLTFEWGEGSVFAFPRNTTHRLFNTGSEPVIFMAVTTAPEIINALDDLDFVFNCDAQFIDLYREGDHYFTASDLRTTEGWYRQTIWHTNFIPDARRAALDALEQKVAGGLLTGYRMGKRFPHGHISQWPPGRYHKAHYHGPGAILLGLDGEGYVLAWDSKLGPRPYEAGHGDQVYKVHWGRNSIYSPPDGYFHQHFNTGAGPARHIAVYGAPHPLAHRAEVDEANRSWKGFLSLREGGTLIEHYDEDPQIRKDFEATLRQKGLESRMDPRLYEPKAA